MRLRELAATRVRYGYRRLHILLRRKGWAINAKRVYRLYREELLGLRTTTPRRRIRLLTIVDYFTRESLAIEVGPWFRGQDVVLALERIAEHRRLPKTIQVDNGPEFTSKAPDQWAYANQVVLDYSRPGKPTDNAFIVSFNGSVRAECLNENWLLSLEDAKEKIESWQRDYNEHRTHSALGNLAPRIFSLGLVQKRVAIQATAIRVHRFTFSSAILVRTETP